MPSDHDKRNKPGAAAAADDAHDGAPRPVTSAPKSVFDIDRQNSRAARAPWIDPDAMVIHKGVALPPPRENPEGNVAQRLLRRMSPGDMVRVTHQQANNLYPYAKKAGIKIARRKLDAELTGIWRIA